MKFWACFLSLVLVVSAHASWVVSGHDPESFLGFESVTPTWAILQYQGGTWSLYLPDTEDFYSGQAAVDGAFALDGSSLPSGEYGWIEDGGLSWPGSWAQDLGFGDGEGATALLPEGIYGDIETIRVWMLGGFVSLAGAGLMLKLGRKVWNKFNGVGSIGGGISQPRSSKPKTNTWKRNFRKGRSGWYKRYQKAQNPNSRELRHGIKHGKYF